MNSQAIPLERASAPVLKHNRVALRQLRRSWVGFAAFCALFLAGGLALLQIHLGMGYAWRWAAQAGLVLVYVTVVLWKGLATNHRLGEEALLPALGWGNRLTLLRGVLVAGLVGFFLLPEPNSWLVWLPGICYTLANATDFFDGYLARRTNHATRLGERLDMSLDGLGVLAAVVLAVQYGRLPGWYLLVGLARYLFLAGLAWRRRKNLPVFDLPPSIARRLMAGLQMGFLAVMLWPLFEPPGTYLAAALFGLPLLLGFTRDWLLVSGARFPRWTRGWPTWLSAWLPVLLRLAQALLLGSLLGERYLHFSTLSSELQILTLLETVGSLGLLLGVLSRTTAILLLILLGFHQMISPLNAAQMLLAGLYVGALFLGPGRFALWAPEEVLVLHRLGGQQRERVG